MEDKGKLCLNKQELKDNENSLIPALNECERFVNFLNNKFGLGLPNNYLITINKTKKSAVGFFMGKEHPEHFTNTSQDLNNINLNTYFLKTNNPYECLAHEVAHFLNHILKVKDCTSNQYHNKYFKKQAERLFLKVERSKKGYNLTSESEEFNTMLEEFKAKRQVFNIFQNQNKNKGVGSRMRLFICSCGVKVRCAVDLSATCNLCKSKFDEVEK